MKFERKSAPGMPDVHAAVITCRVKRYHGGYDEPRLRPVTVAVRAIKERSGKWRVDQSPLVTGGAWAPWEPIISTELNSLTAAKSAIRTFARACKVGR